MAYCPINLEPLPAGQSYSEAGLRSIHSKLNHLEPLEYSYAAQLAEVRRRSDKMSIQGVQPKLSAVLKLKDSSFALVDRGDDLFSSQIRWHTKRCLRMRR